jgi:hypothetical protein
MVPLLLTEPDLLVLAHHPLGASTGYMSDLRGDWPALVAQAVELSPFAAELSVLSEAEVDGLSRFLGSEPPLSFRYVSVHGPSKGRAMSEHDLVCALVDLAQHADCVVMHPDTIEDTALYVALERKLVLENMDAGKNDGCTVEQLERWFEALPQAGFCFDIAHAWSIDQTMGLATGLLDAFRSRLRHVHVSSLSADLHHVPLTEKDEALLMPLLERCLDVPWILEAPLRDR